MSANSEPVREPCCDYRDHAGDQCPCSEHPATELHPFGYFTLYDPSLDNEAFEGWGPGL